MCKHTAVPRVMTDIPLNNCAQWGWGGDGRHTQTSVWTLHPCEMRLCWEALSHVAKLQMLQQLLSVAQSQDQPQ